MEPYKFDVFFMKIHVYGEFFIKNLWNFVRLGYFLDQNLGLGVIYHTVSSESQDSSVIQWKILKMSSVLLIKSQNVVNVLFQFIFLKHFSTKR